MSGVVDVVRVLADLFGVLRGSLGVGVSVSFVGRSLLDYVDSSGYSSLVGSLGTDFVYLWRGEGGDYVVGFIDSSSRSVGFDLARLHVVGAAGFFGGDFIYVPNLSGDSPLDVPFLAIKSIEEVLKSIESRLGKLIKVRNLVGDYYLPDYKDDDIGDELRVLVETNLISRLGKCDLIDALVIDGPIYHLPTQALYSRYGRLFTELVKLRVNTVEGSEVPVIGFVKRVELSRKLIRCREVREFIRSRLGRELPPDTNDAVVAEYILRAFKDVPVHHPVLIGPLRYTYLNPPKELSNVRLSRVYWYVVRKSIAGTQVARIEVLEDHWRRWREVIRDIIDTILSTLTIRNVPLGIELVDRVAKRLSGTTYLIVANELSRVLNLSYDEYDRISEVSKELIRVE